MQQKQKGKVRKQVTLPFARLHGTESAKLRYIEGKVCGFMVLRRSMSKKPSLPLSPLSPQWGKGPHKKPCSKSYSLFCSTKESAGGKR